MIREDNLVMLKGSGFSLQSTDFEPNVLYRSIKLSDKNGCEILVFGVVFSESEFNALFQSAHGLILKELESLNVINNGKLVSKTKFGKLLNVHQYGRTSRDGFKIGLLYKDSKELMYVFMPLFKGDTKENTITIAYNHIKEIISGNLDSLDNRLVQRTNTGIPLSMSPNHIFKFENKKNVKNWELI